MTTEHTVTGHFAITRWDETLYQELGDGAKFVHLSASDEFSGGMAGAATAEEAHLIRADDTRAFAGMIVFTGRIGDRDGRFVIQTTGTFDGTVADSEWLVVPGSGTGGFRGLRGHGTDRAHADDTPYVDYTLTYWFDPATSAR